MVGQQSKYYPRLIENFCNALVATLESPVPNFVSVRWEYAIMTLVLIDANISSASADIRAISDARGVALSVVDLLGSTLDVEIANWQIEIVRLGQNRL